MSLIINQGKHNPSATAFEPIVAKNVVAEIDNVELSTKVDDAINLTMRILAGPYKNKFIFDSVPFKASHAFSWKYITMRKSAGVPYTEDEPAEIDIQELLEGQAVTLNLGIRKDKSTGNEYQRVDYIASKGEAAAVTGDEEEITEFDVPESETYQGDGSTLEEVFVEETETEEEPAPEPVTKTKPKKQPAQPAEKPKQNALPIDDPNEPEDW